MKILATYSIKGGVGKTTAAVNLAYEAALTGARVLLWDLDPQGAATFCLRVRPKVKGGAERLISSRGELESHLRATDVTGLEVVPADFSLRLLDVHLDDAKQPRKRLNRLLEPLDDRYDVAILDCPPGISLVAESVFGAADALIVPTIPSALSARTLDQLAGFLADVSHPPAVWPFFSMADRRRKLQRETIETLLATWPSVLHTVVPAASEIERMGAECAPVGLFAPRGAGTQAFRSLWAEIAERLWD